MYIPFGMVCILALKRAKYKNNNWKKSDAERLKSILVLVVELAQYEISDVFLDL